jgi:hypothetical protein
MPPEQIYAGFTVQAVFKKILMLVLTLLFLLDLFFQAIQQENAADLQLESQEVQDAVQRLYVYWAAYWLIRQTPARFSVNGDKSRTNYDIENWNRWFNARCHGHRQNFWAFICN